MLRRSRYSAAWKAFTHARYRSTNLRRAPGFRALAAEFGESPAALAHRYALSMPRVATVVLGVKDRVELRECLQTEAKGVLSADVMGRIDASVAPAT